MNVPDSGPAFSNQPPQDGPAPPLVQSPKPASPKPVSLAKRISSRTTDLLAIAIILIGSLTLGRRVLEWWREDPPPVLDAGPLANLSTEWGADGKPVHLEFADSPFRLIRQSIAQGGPVVALRTVQEECQRALLEAEQPNSLPNQAEREMLKTVLKLQPEVEQPGAWQIYRLGGNMVTLVGVRFFPKSEQKLDKTNDAVDPRVVCWGLVFPGGSVGSWTAYTFVKTNQKTRSESGPPAGSNQNASELDLGQVSLPSGSLRTLLVRESAWNSLLGFQGSGQVASWRQHFIDWFAEQGWTLIEENHNGVETEGWSANFVQHREAPGNSNQVLIQLQFDSAGRGTGLIHGLPGKVEKTAVDEAD